MKHHHYYHYNYLPLLVLVSHSGWCLHTIQRHIRSSAPSLHSGEAETTKA